MKIKELASTFSRYLHSGEFDKLLQLDLMLYTNYLKQSEISEIYENVYSVTDSFLAEYGSFLRSQLPMKDGTQRNRVCYLIPNLDNDLAHIETFYNIFCHHSSTSDLEIFVAGEVAEKNNPRSRMIRQLVIDKKIKILEYAYSHAGALKFCSDFFNLHFAQVIVFSVPLLLPALVRALGPENVTWLTTKFELDSFKELRNRTSLFSWRKDVIYKGDSRWIRSLGALNAGEVPSFNARIDVKELRLVSLNREEKINHPTFLNSVSQILKNRENAIFHYTGRQNLENIKNFFSQQGLANRVRYIGWVNFSEVISNYDIFLDTPTLSGSIAAKACVAGLPYVGWRGSNSWLELFEGPITSELDEANAPWHLDEIICSDSDKFVSMVLKLIDDQKFRSDFSKSLQYVTEACFGNTVEMYHQHCDVIKGFIREPKRSLYQFKSAICHTNPLG